MVDLLFVYGTLRSEFDNFQARRLRTRAVLLGAAEVSGSVVTVGEYTGYRRGADGMVRGEVYRLRDPEIALADLDIYEGSEYRRVVVDTEFGEAWIYEYAGDSGLS